MKYPIICGLALMSIATGVFGQDPGAGKKVRDTGSQPPIFLPFDFYPRHREEVGLTEDQTRHMQRIAENMQETARRLEEVRARGTKELQQVMEENPIDEEKAMERFHMILNAENELKALQFRGGIAMRNALSPEQLGKVRQLAMKENATRSADVRMVFNERLQQLRAEIQKRTGGDPPPELVERLRQIEQAAKNGKFGEAKNLLEQVLQNLRSAPP